MKGKKVLLVLGMLMIIFPFRNAYAWGGYAHWEIANRFSDNMSPDEKLYYTSGSTLADIGRLSWDNKYTSSDSLEFSNKMNEIVLQQNWTRTKHKKFAQGWMGHYIQDNKGSLSNIQGGPKSYRVKCGWVDEYLRDDKKIQSPINGRSEIVVDYELIRETYNQLHGFKPNNDEINKQIKTIFLAYDLQIIANFNKWSNEEKKSIEKELNRTVDLCKESIRVGMYNSLQYDLLNRDRNKRLEDIRILNYTINNVLEELENDNTIEYLSYIKDNNHYFELKVKNRVKYDEKLKNTLEVLNSKDINIQSILE